MTTRIEIDLDKKCKKCGEKGATQNNLCLKCITKALTNGEYDHILDRHRNENPLSHSAC